MIFLRFRTLVKHPTTSLKCFGINEDRNRTTKMVQVAQKHLMRVLKLRCLNALPQTCQAVLVTFYPIKKL